MTAFKIIPSKRFKFPDGILVINKPKSITSNQALDIVKKFSIGKLKVGHSGVLDQSAVGLLILGIGRYTKKLSDLIGSIKTYKTTIVFGNNTTTGAEDGSIVHPFKPFSHINIDLVNETIKKNFVGSIHQKTPLYSAVKLNGKRISDLTIKGINVEPPTRNVFVYNAKCTLLKLPVAEFELKVSSGFYVRSFAVDICNLMNTAGYCVEINRIENGPFNQNNALNLEDISEETVNNNIHQNNQLVDNQEYLKQFLGNKSEVITTAKIIINK